MLGYSVFKQKHLVRTVPYSILEGTIVYCSKYHVFELQTISNFVLHIKDKIIQNVYYFCSAYLCNSEYFVTYVYWCAVTNLHIYI